MSLKVNHRAALRCILHLGVQISESHTSVRGCCIKAFECVHVSAWCRTLNSCETHFDPARGDSWLPYREEENVSSPCIVGAGWKSLQQTLILSVAESSFIFQGCRVTQVITWKILNKNHVSRSIVSFIIVFNFRSYYLQVSLHCIIFWLTDVSMTLVDCVKDLKPKCILN